MSPRGVGGRVGSVRAIFISYRREDAEGQAGRLFEDLVRHFGDHSVFMDVAGIEPGRDFRKTIDESVASCSVLLAVMGKSWLGVKDEAGQRRLDNPRDFVRMETASALKRDIPVVPVLVQGARMPTAEQLPPDLAELAFRNAIELTHARWDSDVALLIAALERQLDPMAVDVPARTSRAVAARGGKGRWQLAALLVSIAAVTSGGVALWKRGWPETRTSALQAAPEAKAPTPTPDPEPPAPEPPAPKPNPPAPPAPKREPAPNPPVDEPAHDQHRLAPKLAGKWSWGQRCSERVRLVKGRLVFGAGDAAFVHVILSDDGTTLRTRVSAPPQHAGDRYEFRLEGTRLSLYEPQTGERNEWTRCGD